MRKDIRKSTQLTAVAVVFAASLAVIGGSITFASEKSERANATAGSQAVSAATTATDSTTSDNTTDSTHPADSSRTTIQQQAASRLAEIKAKVQAQRDSIKQTLQGDRLKRCEARESAIKTILSNSQDHEQKILTRLQNTEASVRKFYTNKNISLSNYATLSAAMDDAEATAIASVHAASGNTFSCTADDATNPGGILKNSINETHAALNAYRSAIRDFIAAIKKSLEPESTTGTSQPTGDTTHDSTTTQGAQ